MSKVDMSNFMGVIQATKQNEKGLVFSGDHMPSGNPVVAPGATLAELMSDKSMAEQWYESIRGTYEREQAERDHARSIGDTPDLVINGADGAAPEPARSAVAAQVDSRTLEEELQARQEEWEVRVYELRPALAEAERELTNVEAALAAIRGT